jgi:presenilin-like A22 family membrane protease
MESPELGAEKISRKFKPRLSHLYPVMLSLTVTGLLGYPILGSNAQVPITAFQGNTLSGASLNALYFVAALAITASVMLYLVRRGKLGILRQLVKVAVVFVCFIVAVWYSSLILTLFASGLSYAASLDAIVVLSIVVAAGLGLFVFGKGQRRNLIGVVMLSALTGVFLGFNIDPLTAIVLAGALVVYDIVAVFRGPVGALARSMDEEQLPGAMFTYQELTIGMGDMVFYSLLAMTALTFGTVSFFGAAIGILAGSFLGFKMLTRYEMFPGLPFSLLLGIAGMFAGQFLAPFL